MVDLAHSPTLVATGPASGERLAEGQTAGEYVIERFLGAGAMGEVYAGHQPVIGKRVAIKVLRRELAASAEAAERFTREARAANQVDHPGVIDVFAFGRLDDGRLYLVMDLVDGRSLRAELANGPLPLPDALEILDGIAGALDAAHARGVVHRDLKPDNIMITGGQPLESDKSTIIPPRSQRRVFVLDFGIAKLLASTTDTGPGTLTGQGTWLGTPGYMAPEQWSADGAGPASDRYALGVIAFELLAGALPFSASSVPAMMEQHFRAEVPALSTRGRVPTAVDPVLRQALAKDPEARFGSARELVDALRAAAGTGIGARAALVPPTSSPRRPWLPAAIGVGVLGAGMAALIASRGAHRDERSENPAAPPSGTVALDVRSSPPGAEVTLGDRMVGVTPVALNLEPGTSAALVVRKPGYLADRRTVTAPAAGGGIDVALVEVTRFTGVWQLPSGELRAFERDRDRVSVSKLDEVTAPRRFYKLYPFVAADQGIAFGSDDEVGDPRAPDDPKCHVPVHVEYVYDPETDKLELHRPKVTFDRVDGHCVTNAQEPMTEPLVRVGGSRDTVDVLAPAGLPQKQAKPRLKPTKKIVPLDPITKNAPKNNAFDTVGQKPTSPYTNTKANPVDNINQGNQEAPQAQIVPQPQAPPIQAQQAPQQKQ